MPGNTIFPLANFGTWTETGATVNSGVITSFPDDEITMANNSGPVFGPLHSLAVKRVLLTGMSGTGKSSVARALTTRGYKAIDTDDGWSQLLPDGRQRWREGAITELLATEDTDVLFVVGCEENQVRFHPQFDHIVLLSAPAETLMERLASRTSNPFGKDPGELSRVLNDLQTVEPLLRQVADHEVRTTIPLDDVVTIILRLVGVQ